MKLLDLYSPQIEQGTKITTNLRQIPWLQNGLTLGTKKELWDSILPQESEIRTFIRNEMIKDLLTTLSHEITGLQKKVIREGQLNVQFHEWAKIQYQELKLLLKDIEHRYSIVRSEYRSNPLRILIEHYAELYYTKATTNEEIFLLYTRITAIQEELEKCLPFVEEIGTRFEKEMESTLSDWITMREYSTLENSLRRMILAL